MVDNKTIKPAMDLIYLVSCAVNEVIPDKKICSQMDMPDLCLCMRRHALSAAAACALEQAVELPDDIKEAKYKAFRRASIQNIERGQILDSLEKQGIWYLPLKGIVLKEYYPVTAMREMSDNDILCDSERMKDVRSVMEGLGFECKSFGKIHHDVYEKPLQIDFEMHRSLFEQTEAPEIYSYFENIKEKLVKDSGNSFGYHMTNEDMYIYLICHLRNHYLSVGTGLRSLLDIYMFGKRCGGKLDRDYLDAELRKLCLTEFEQKLRSLSEKTFSFKELSEEEISMLCFFIDSGSHGTMENLMMFMLDNDDSGKAKSKYILKRVFPSREDLKRDHPVVYSHKALYPLWLAYRPIRGVLTHPKGIAKEVKRLKNFKKKENADVYK